MLPVAPHYCQLSFSQQVVSPVLCKYSSCANHFTWTYECSHGNDGHGQVLGAGISLSLVNVHSHFAVLSKPDNLSNHAATPGNISIKVSYCAPQGSTSAAILYTLPCLAVCYIALSVPLMIVYITTLSPKHYKQMRAMVCKFFY